MGCSFVVAVVACFYILKEFMFWIDRYISIDGIHIYVVRNLNDAQGNAVKISLPIWILGIQFPPGRHPTLLDSGSSLTAVSHLWLFSPSSPFLFSFSFFFSLPGPSPPFIPVLCLFSALLLPEKKTSLMKVMAFILFFLGRHTFWGFPKKSGSHLKYLAISVKCTILFFS